MNGRGKHSSLLPCDNNNGHKKFLVQAPEPNFIKAFASVIYKCSQKAQVFVTCKTFHPSLMFASKAKAYPGEAPFSFSTQGWPYPQTLD